MPALLLLSIKIETLSLFAAPHRRAGRSKQYCAMRGGQIRTEGSCEETSALPLGQHCFGWISLGFVQVYSHISSLGNLPRFHPCKPRTISVRAPLYTVLAAGVLRRADTGQVLVIIRCNCRLVRPCEPPSPALLVIMTDC